MDLLRSLWPPLYTQNTSGLGCLPPWPTLQGVSHSVRCNFNPSFGFTWPSTPYKETFQHGVPQIWMKCHNFLGLCKALRWRILEMQGHQLSRGPTLTTGNERRKVADKFLLSTFWEVAKLCVFFPCKLSPEVHRAIQTHLLKDQLCLFRLLWSCSPHEGDEWLRVSSSLIRHYFPPQPPWAATSQIKEDILASSSVLQKTG